MTELLGLKLECRRRMTAQESGADGMVFTDHECGETEKSHLVCNVQIKVQLGLRAVLYSLEDIKLRIIRLRSSSSPRYS